LRQDIVSGDWVVIATGRARRPHEFLRQKRSPFRQPKRTCPFERVIAGTRSLYYPEDSTARKKEWIVQVIPNKYPVFEAKGGVCPEFHASDPYQWTEGVGFHEVVITRFHERSLARMSDEEVLLVVKAYQERYLALQKEACVEYVSIFHNHGRLSGATITHPHSQIIAIPVIPPDVVRSLQGSALYFHKYERECIHCLVITHERKADERVVYENDRFIALAPYASKVSFEIRIFPKVHSAWFEAMDEVTRAAFANALRVALAKLFKGLQNPDYNFFLHTAPARNPERFSHYHWHLEILPKTAMWAGFEIGTGIEISAIAPEAAAAFLKKMKV